MSENPENEETNGLKNLKDIKSINEVDFKEYELIRGETPPDIKERCLKLCQQYLTGNWDQQTIDTIAVKRVTGGMINQIYHCAIIEPNSSEEVPQEVSVKLYGENVYGSFENSRTRDVVNALIFSENYLGPKIYGLFEEGQIQQYYKHRQFKEQEQKDPVLRETVFKTLAKIHSLEVPIKKDPNWLSNLINKSYEEAIEKFDFNNEMDEFNCEAMKKFDWRAEIDFVSNVAKNSESPVVFTHNDFRSSNILVTEPNDQLVVCDFDITGYGYRGYDFVVLRVEWGRPQFDKTRGIVVKDEEFKSLIEIYVEECQRIYGKSYSENEINSVEHILQEVKIFSFISTLLGATFFMKNDDKNGGFPFCRRVVMEMAEQSIIRYNTLKVELKEQNII